MPDILLLGKEARMRGVRLKVWGEHALFTRPENKAERMSYDVPTPSAARGILEAIHWKPAIRWEVERIHVLNPIVFDSIRRNEVGKKGPAPREIRIPRPRERRVRTKRFLNRKRFLQAIVRIPPEYPHVFSGSDFFGFLPAPFFFLLL